MSSSSLVDVTRLGYFKTKQDATNDAKFVAQETGKSLLADTEATRLEGMETGAQVNIIEDVKVNGTSQTVTSKAINITVPTQVSDLTNDSGFQTAAQVEAAIASATTSAYRAAGSKTAAELTSALLIAANEGKVYNVSDALTTTGDFVEGSGKTHPAGTNVVVIEATPAEGNTAATYKFDVLAGFVDLSTYLQNTDVASNSDIDTIFSST